MWKWTDMGGVIKKEPVELNGDEHYDLDMVIQRLNIDNDSAEAELMNHGDVICPMCGLESVFATTDQDVKNGFDFV